MKKTILTTSLCISLNASAFLDFNSYGPGYDDNDWPVWTPMYWMEEMFGDNDNDRRYRYYPYPYNNAPYNIGAQHFNMQQMPTPDCAYQLETNTAPMQNQVYMSSRCIRFYQHQLKPPQCLMALIL